MMSMWLVLYRLLVACNKLLVGQKEASQVMHNEGGGSRHGRAIPISIFKWEKMNIPE